MKKKTSKITDWTEDELIESINFYNSNPYAISTDPEIAEQSELLRELSSVPVELRPENFRSIASMIKKHLCWVRLDLANSGTGLGNISPLDIKMWKKHGKSCYNASAAKAAKTARRNAKIEDEKEMIANALAKELATRPPFKKTMFGISLG